MRSFFVFASLGCSELSSPRPISPTTTSQVSFLHVPADFSTIQDAIDATSSNEIILVSGGWYTEDLILRDGTSLRGDPTQTRLQGTIFAHNVRAEVYGIQIEDWDDTVELVGAEVKFDHCTMKGGVSRLFSGSIGEFQNCTFDGRGQGSAIRVNSGYAKIEKSIIEYYQVGLDSLLGSSTAAGEISETVFWGNFADIRGMWNGKPIVGDPLHTDRPWEYFLDENSAALLPSGDYAGAWRSIDFEARPDVTVLPTPSTTIVPSVTAQTVLEFEIEAGGAATGAVVVHALELEVYSSVSVNSPVNWELRDGTTLVSNPQFGIYPNGRYYLGLGNYIIQVGAKRKLRLDIDLSAFFMSGDSIEVVLRSIRWSDGGLVTNGNGQGIGLPLGGASSGKLSVP